METIYHGVRQGRTLNDGTPRYLATLFAGRGERYHIGSYSTAFEAARAVDYAVWDCSSTIRYKWNFPPLRYVRRPCLPGTTLRDVIVAKARAAMLRASVPTRFEREAEARKRVLAARWDVV